MRSATRKTRSAAYVFGVAALGATLFTAACLGTPAEFEDTGVIVFNNGTNAGFSEVRVRVCNDSAFGNDLMGDLESVPPGREFRVRVSPGCWDGRILFLDGGATVRSGITVRKDEETVINITSN